MPSDAVDPYRVYLCQRRAKDPAVPVLQLLGEVRARGYTGSRKLLYRYVTQGRVEDSRPGPSPRKLARLPLASLDSLKPDQHGFLHKTTRRLPRDERARRIGPPAGACRQPRLLRGPNT